METGEVEDRLDRIEDKLDDLERLNPSNTHVRTGISRGVDDIQKQVDMIRDQVRDSET